MDIKSINAFQSYTQSKTSVFPNPSEESGISFANFVDNITGALNQHEKVAVSAMMGQTDPHALVEALASSQMAVDTVTAIRDKVVEAYQEIIRMPI